MTWDFAKFKTLVDAEEYFDFFQLPYDPQVVNVNRLHILRKFSQSLKEIDATNPTEEQKFEQYRLAFQKAYEVFLSSTAVDEKLFKVFQQKPANVVLLSEIDAEVDADCETAV
jgi:nitrogenase-stabilizing/protective protein